MIVEFGHLISVDGIANLPEQFYEKFQFRIIIEGSRVSYRVEFKPEDPHITNRISREELLKISQTESGGSCRPALKKLVGKKNAGDASRRSETSDSTLRERVSRLPTKDSVEEDIKQFLLAMITANVVPRFVQARLCSKSFVNDFKSPMSVLFPTRTNAGLKISTSELEAARGLFPKCITDANDFSIQDTDGNIYVLPPFPADKRFESREAHRKLVSESRIPGFSFAKISMALTKWSRTVVPRTAVKSKEAAIVPVPGGPEPTIAAEAIAKATSPIFAASSRVGEPTNTMCGQDRTADVPFAESTTVRLGQSSEGRWIAGKEDPASKLPRAVKPMEERKELPESYPAETPKRPGPMSQVKKFARPSIAKGGKQGVSRNKRENRRKRKKHRLKVHSKRKEENHLDFLLKEASEPGSFTEAYATAVQQIAVDEDRTFVPRCWKGLPVLGEIFRNALSSYQQPVKIALALGAVWSLWNDDRTRIMMEMWGSTEEGGNALEYVRRLAGRMTT